MSYEPTNWQAGDIVTSAKLNKLEQGVANGGGILVVHEDENSRLDKTWQEIYDAEVAVIQTIEDNDKSTSLISQISIRDNTYYVILVNSLGRTIYSTSSPDDYPVFQTTEIGGGGK